MISDKVRERNETLTVTLTDASYGSIADGTATGTIVNDDTRVGLGLARATQHRVKVHVDTLPEAPGAPVKVYRLDKGGRTLVLKTDLNRLGRVTKVLARHYKPGTKVSLHGGRAHEVRLLPLAHGQHHRPALITTAPHREGRARSSGSAPSALVRPCLLRARFRIPGAHGAVANGVAECDGVDTKACGQRLHLPGRARGPARRPSTSRGSRRW